MTTIDDARALLAAGHHDDAVAACRAILANDVLDSAALSVLGRCFLAMGRHAEAIALLSACEEDIALLSASESEGLISASDDEAPDSVPNGDTPASRRADGTASRPAGATTAMPTPTDTTEETRLALTEALRAAGLAAEADASGRPATAPAVAIADQDAAITHLQRGNAHLVADELDLAAAAYRRALSHNPRFPGALGNLGNVLTAQGALPDAHAAYQEALRLDPNNAEIAYAYSLSLLLAGDFDQGWHWHESRRRTRGLRWNYERHPDLPQWRDGMDLAGRRVLVTAEQGHGDMIQVSRLVPVLADQAALVVLELPRTLHRVFETMPDTVRLIDRDGQVPACDLACPLLSLPRALGLTLDTIPPPVATAREDLVAQWAAWLGAPDGRRRIGLVVSGDSRHPHDARRSVPLARFEPILATGHRFILLQTELRDADRATRDGIDGLRFPGAALTDFGDTAGLIANLDLVITVDTAVAHLAGSLGVPTWVMLAHAPDHRWMLNRDDSPWYPSLRLFRQPSPGDWESVLRRMADALD